MSKKTSLLVRSQFLRLFRNTLTADHMSSPHNRVKFLTQLQMPLSPKSKIFSNLHKFLRILKKKISFISQIFLKLPTPKNVVTWMPESFRFITPFRTQRVHRSQTLMNFALPKFYPNFTLIQEKSELGNISLSQIWDLGTAW